MTSPDTYPSVVVTAGEARHIEGMTGDMLRMHDGATYIHISPAVARQWVTVLQTIATKDNA